MIFQKTIRRIRYKIAKYMVKHDKVNAELSETQQNVIKIYKNLLAKSDTEMFVAPISGKKYIRHGEVTATIIGDAIVVVNHKYYYNVQVPRSVTDKLSLKFDLKLEHRRNRMENELSENVNSSLTDILLEIKNEPTEKN